MRRNVSIIMRSRRARRKVITAHPVGWSAAPARPTLARFVVGVAILAVLVGLAGVLGNLALARDWFDAFDAAFAVVPDPNHRLTAFFIAVTWLGTQTGIVTLSLLMFVVLLVRRAYRGAVALVCSAATAGIVNDLLKDWVARERPEHPGLVEAAGYSYLSGHAFVCTAVYGLFAYLLLRNMNRAGRRVALLILTVVLLGLIGYSRIYLGVHYASDVAGGYLLGIAWMAVWAKVFFPSNARTARR